MIYQLDILDSTKTPVPWLSKVETFKEPRTLEFKPGLNILWGRNGSGKTSLTKVLARLLHCEQSGQPCVTQESLLALNADQILDEVNLKKGLRIQHDGQGTRHFDPGHAPGLVGGAAAFDGDFMTEGLANAMFKGSAGQTTLFRFDRLMGEVITGTVPEVIWKFSRDRCNSTWARRVELATFFLQGNATKGLPTMLLDEPERSYDLNTQVGIWRFLRAYADQVQFIVASHSLFALKIPEAHYIELSPRYLAKSEAALHLLPKWPEENPAKVPKQSAQSPDHAPPGTTTSYEGSRRVPRKSHAKGT